MLQMTLLRCNITAKIEVILFNINQMRMESAVYIINIALFMSDKLDLSDVVRVSDKMPRSRAFGSKNTWRAANGRKGP
jgi:hypothetical protein